MSKFGLSFESAPKRVRSASLQKQQQLLRQQQDQTSLLPNSSHQSLPPLQHISPPPAQSACLSACDNVMTLTSDCDNVGEMPSGNASSHWIDDFDFSSISDSASATNDQALRLGADGLAGIDMLYIGSNPQSPTPSTAAKEKYKTCSVCGQSKPKIGHRLQNCDKKEHTDCNLVCNSCEDFFRRHMISTQEKLIDCGGGDICKAAGSKKPICQHHRMKTCLEIGMALRDMPRRDGGVAAERLPVNRPILNQNISTVAAPVQGQPNWLCAINKFCEPATLLEAFCDSLKVNGERIRKFNSVEEVMSQPTEYSALLRLYSPDDAQTIRHECLSGQLLLQCFWTFVEDGFSEADLKEIGNKHPVGVPMCVAIAYVTQKKLMVGRDLIPITQNRDYVPMHPLAYDFYLGSVPRQCFMIERRESTTTPPFALGVERPKTKKEVEFYVTSKLSRGNTVLHVRRHGETEIMPLRVDVPVKVCDGDTLSIHNEYSRTIELIAWRIVLPKYNNAAA